MFTIEMLPAYLGDSLWIEYGDPDKPHRILIDGGLVGTADSVKAKIDAVADREGTCRLDLLVVTHIDGDHIEGMVKLLGLANLRLDVADVWFNGRKHMPDPGGGDEEEFLGARQAEFMSLLIEHRGFPWNDAVEGRTLYVPPASKAELPKLALPGGMDITLLSPRYQELLGLAKNWEKELAKAGLDKATEDELVQALLKDRRLSPEDDEEFLGAKTMDVPTLIASQTVGDHSDANGASIAFVAGYEGASCLLTGDAWAPVLTEGADRLASETGDPRLALTALKVPHHGSKNNLDEDLLERIDTHRFLISSDGSRFGHPDREAIARILGGRGRPDPGADQTIDLYFNYRSKFNSVWDDPGLQQRWNYRTHFPADGAEGLVVDIAGDAPGSGQRND
jgi:beta-lactamase superfamily II metal-dependent hydrolase